MQLTVGRRPWLTLHRQSQLVVLHGGKVMCVNARGASFVYIALVIFETSTGTLALPWWLSLFSVFCSKSTSPSAKKEWRQEITYFWPKIWGQMSIIKRSVTRRDSLLRFLQHTLGCVYVPFSVTTRGCCGLNTAPMTVINSRNWHSLVHGNKSVLLWSVLEAISWLGNKDWRRNLEVAALPVLTRSSTLLAFYRKWK